MLVVKVQNHIMRTSQLNPRTSAYVVYTCIHPWFHNQINFCLPNRPSHTPRHVESLHDSSFPIVSAAFAVYKGNNVDVVGSLVDGKLIDVAAIVIKDRNDRLPLDIVYVLNIGCS